MKKIWNAFKQRMLCITVESNQEMVHLAQFSPRVMRPKSKKQGMPGENRKSQPNPDDEFQKKTESFARPNEGGETKTETPKMNSVSANIGSTNTGTISFLTPKSENDPLNTNRSFRNLLPPKNLLPGRSPPIKTVSADTPQRSEKFHREIEDVTKCSVRILGRGNFTTIIRATYKGELVAVKIVPAQKAVSLRNELNNFLLSHPNIVRTLRVIGSDSGSCGLVIMEIHPSITLEHLIMEKPCQLSDQLILKYMTDVSRALDYCHDQQVLHLDVKPKNVLVHVTRNSCKLCDFGSSCIVMGDDTVKEKNLTGQSTSVYTPPELLMGEPATKKADVYSFGVMLWQVVHEEKLQFMENKTHLQSAINKILKKKEQFTKKEHQKEALESLCILCWNEPIKRPTMKEMKNFLENILT